MQKPRSGAEYGRHKSHQVLRLMELVFRMENSLGMMQNGIKMELGKGFCEGCPIIVQAESPDVFAERVNGGQVNDPLLFF